MFPFSLPVPLVAEQPLANLAFAGHSNICNIVMLALFAIAGINTPHAFGHELHARLTEGATGYSGK